MGIIYELTKVGSPDHIRMNTRLYVRFNARLAEQKVYVKFYTNCISACEFTKQIYDFVKKNSSITPANLSRYTLLLIDKHKAEAIEYENKIANLLRQLDCLPDSTFLDLSIEVEKIKSTVTWKLEMKLLHSLRNSQSVCAFPHNPKQYVFNLTDLELSELQFEILSLGPKFCIPARKYNNLEDEASIEDFFSQLDQDDIILPDKRAAVKADIMSAFNQYRKSNPINSLITREHITALKQLKDNKDIILQRLDKGSGTAVINRATYLNDMLKILYDDKKFKPLDDKQINLAAIEQNVNKLITELLDTQAINQQEAWNLRARGSTLPSLYGLPKVHKIDLTKNPTEEIPLRPILSMVNSPYHKIARWLCSVLTPIKEQLCKHSIKNAFQFTELIKRTDLTNAKMLSFDVSSLFTNVPIEETIEYLCEKITVSFQPFPIPIDLLKRLLYTCTYKIPFSFNGNYYRQDDGVAMGTPLGPLLADIFMSKLENEHIHNTIEKLICYVRYVDDTFIACPRRTSTRQLLKEFNSCHPDIKFTMEEENDDCLPFLDLKLIRSPNDNIVTRIHYKKTWTGQYLNFHSFVPTSMKRNLIRNMILRIRKIVTSEFQNEDIKIFQDALLKIGYPKPFIDLYSEVKPRVNTPSNDSKRPVFLKIQYRGESGAELFRRRISRTLQENCNNVMPRMVFTSRALFTFQSRDRPTKLATSNVVYQFTCTCGLQYIGRTERRLKDRICEHIHGNLEKSPSSIGQHIFNTEHHQISEDNFRVLFKAQNRKILKILEAVAIRNLKPQLNIQTPSDYQLKLNWR